MPRDISGNYSLPPGINPVFPNTVIESDWCNPTMNDIAAALSDSLSRSGSGGMLVPFRNADGVVGAPGMSWLNEPTSGWYRASLNDFRYSVGNEDIFKITKAGIELMPGKTALNISSFTRVQDDEPTAPPVKMGEQWYESDTGGFMMRYQNPDATFTWVSLAAAGGDFIPWPMRGAANGVASLDANGKVPVTQLPGALPLLGGRNALINGGIRIWQRGISFNPVVGNVYTADRWKFYVATTGTIRVDQSTTIPLSQFLASLAGTVLTADTSIAASEYVVFGQVIEGYNWVALHQRPCTLSFWVRSSKTGTFSAALRSAGQDRSCVMEFTINAALTWEYKSITFPASDGSGTWGGQSGIGATLTINLAVGSTYSTTPGTWQNGNFFGSTGQSNFMDSTSNFFYFAGFQLERGTVATEFDFRDVGTDLAQCQRYYEKSYDVNHYPGVAGGLGLEEFRVYSTSFQDYHRIGFKVTKRAAPTMTAWNYSTGTSGTWRDFSASANPAISFVDTGESATVALLPLASSVGMLIGGHWTADAEL